MTVRVPVQPALLRWARARSGISDDEWDSRFPDYQRWLDGVRQPTYRQLQDFAKRTHAPLGYLFLDEPPIEEIPIPDFRTVGDRAVTDQVSADLLDTVYVSQARQEWYRDNQLLHGAHPLRFVGSATLEMPPADVAAEVRAALNWGRDIRDRLPSWDAALAQLRENAENVGILVMISGIVGSNTSRKLDPEEFRGLALADPYAALVFVNGADSKAAQVFTLAHELAHLWLGQNALSDIELESTRSYEQERWCNQVAAELLVPMDEFRAVFDPHEAAGPQLQPLAERFRVSTQVILGRMREAGALTWDQFMEELDAERARVAAIVAERGSGGNYYNTKPVQVGKRFARALLASTYEGRTPYTEAFRLLDIRKSSTLDGLADTLGVR